MAGYFLVEESFKVLLYLRGKKVPTLNPVLELLHHILLMAATIG